MDEVSYDQHVSAFRFADKIILVSNAKTATGLWYLYKPVIAFDANSSPAIAGNYLSTGLAKSITDLPAPPEGAALNDTMQHVFQVAGASTLWHFLTDAAHCGIGRTSHYIEITPAHNYGTVDEPKGFVLKNEEKIVLERDFSLKALGDALLQGFASCTSEHR